MHHRFVDETIINIKAGNGGPGCVSFHHEKFKEFGGPDGGDGGKGGDVYLLPDSRVNTLNHIRHNKLYKAQNGLPGEGRNRTGRNGNDLVIKVPIGTQVFDETRSDLIADLTEEKPWLAATGARGGKGNAFFKSSTHQTPRFSQPGEDTRDLIFYLSLKMIADIGLVGFPNAGKSTLLRALTSANAKTGDYPFTTLEPNLGVLTLSNSKNVIMADIPGIIEGASRGQGLGLSFLKHIERVKVIIYVLDVTMSEVKDELGLLKNELREYNPELIQRPSIIVFNKTDRIKDKDFLKEWISSYEYSEKNTLTISALNKVGLKNLLDRIEAILNS